MGSEAELHTHEPAEEDGPEPSPTDTPSLDRVRLTDDLLGLAAVALLTALGASVFFGGTTFLTLAPVAGIVAALLCVERVDAAGVAAGGTLVGTLLTQLVTRVAWNAPSTWLVRALGVAAVGAAVAYGACWLLERQPRLERLLAGLALAVIVGGSIQYAVVTATTPAPDGSTFAGMIVSAPKIAKDTPDEALYALYVIGLRQGGDYYRVAGEVLQAADDARGGRVDLRSALSFRPPTLYRLMAALPPGGVWLVLLTMLAGGLAAVSAYLLASRFVIRPLALVAAVAVSTYYAGLATRVQLFGTELWAGAFGLLALALFALSRDVPARRSTLVRLAAAAALAATLFRELGVAFLVLGLVATLVDAEDRGARRWDAWAAALAAAAGAWLLHRGAAAPVIATLHPRPLAALPWLNPDGLGTVAAVARIARLLDVQAFAGWALAALGIVGALVAPRDRAVRLALAATVIGGLGILLFMYPPGEAGNGLPPSYWADVTAPAVLACVPLVFALLPAARRLEDSPAEDTGASEVAAAA